MKAENINKSKKIFLIILISAINTFLITVFPFTLVSLIQAFGFPLHGRSFLLPRIIIIIIMELFIMFYCIKVIAKISSLSKIFKYFAHFFIIFATVYLLSNIFIEKESNSCSYKELSEIASIINNKKGQKWDINVLPKYISYNLFKDDDNNDFHIHAKSSFLSKILGISYCSGFIEVTIDKNGKIKETKIFDIKWR